MKAYFSASILGKNRDAVAQKWQELVVSEFKKQGVDVWDGNLKTEPTKLFNESETQYLDIYKRNSNIIRSSDFIIAEVSMTDSGVGYEIAYALDNKKPVIALYNQESTEPTAPPIAGMKNKLLKFSIYDKVNITSIVTTYLKEVKTILDTKFILIISPEIDRYLQWVSENRRMHKAQVVRLSLEEAMSKDKEYKDFLKQQ